MRNATPRTLPAALVAVGLCVSLAAPAVARPRPVRPSGGLDVIATSGACTAGSVWEISGRSRSLRVVVTVRLNTGQKRQRWRVRLLHNRVRVFAGTRSSKRRGVVKVRRRLSNLAGPDAFTLVARNRVTRETCRGTLSF